MTRSRALVGLAVFVALVASALGFNLATKQSPVLGLDLQGGLSVIYGTESVADQAELTAVRDQMRGRLSDFGIVEPDVRVEGQNIIVDLPGVADQDSAIELLKVNGEVSLRPVMQCGPAAMPPTEGTTNTSESTSSTSETTSSSTTVADAEKGDAVVQRPRVRTTPTTVADETPTTTTPAPSTSDSKPTGESDDENTQGGATATTVATLPADTSILQYPNAGQQCLVGPSGGSGEIFSRGSAAPGIDPQDGRWIVNVDLRSEGRVQWNALARECFGRSAACPSGQLAIVLDDVIRSAPTVNVPEFTGGVSISGMADEAEANQLSNVLKRGANPVAVVQERVETVSPTAGQDSLQAAVIAGLIGLAAVLVFMIAYYGRMSLVIVAGLVVWGMTVYSVATFVSRATNYALTLAGATGIIIAVGVTVDTYVVYFERLRDERRNGRTVRNSAHRGFNTTWRTILSADVISLMASIILFVLSVGSVKGFALYLGITTFCDLVVFYFFTRPAVVVLADWIDGRQVTESKEQGVSS